MIKPRHCYFGFAHLCKLQNESIAEKCSMYRVKIVFRVNLYRGVAETKAWKPLSFEVQTKVKINI